jgi:proline dehydrogenase
MINRIIAELIPFMPKRLVWLFSRKYIAGESIDDAVRVVTGLNNGNMLATIDILGESIDRQDKALEYMTLYMKAMEVAATRKLKSSFSLKPTMFGLHWDFELCYTLIRQLVVQAKRYGYFIRIDMEDARCTQLELNLFERLYKEFKNHIGIVLQACLKRTIQDLAYLKNISSVDSPVNVRLCKGIYDEHRTIAYKSREEIRNNFLRCLKYMLANKIFPAIATHDKQLIKNSISLLEKYRKTSVDFEFQMLYGVTPRLRTQLVEQKYALRIYVPFGKQWLKYSVRRLKENPRLVRDIVTALFISR